MAGAKRKGLSILPPRDQVQTPLAEFRIRFMKVVGGVMTAVAITITTALALTGTPVGIYALVGVGALVAGASFALALSGRGEAAVRTVTFGVGALATVFLATAGDIRYVPVAIEVIFVLAVFSAFLIEPRLNMVFGGFIVAMLAVTTGMRASATPDEIVVSLGITDTVHFILLWAAATQVSRHLRANHSALNQRLLEIDVVVQRAKRIATGDLSGDVTRENEVSRVISDMLLGLRDIVGEVHDSVQVLAATTTDIDSMSAQQKRGAVHQSSAVAETRETIQSFAGSAHQIAEAAEGVLNNARSTQATNERAHEQLNALANHTRRINELLEFVKGVASKSEILALNAALEGTRAGEAGRGFSLVAAQMQRLAESTASTIKDVKSLTSDITRATATTGISMEEAIKLARDTTVAAKQITLITQQQSSGAEQVLDAMTDIATVTGEFAESTHDAMAAISELKSLSDRLNSVAHRFVL